jgi:hypothetical protein
MDLHCFGALALEAAADQPAATLCLSRDRAEQLAAAVAADLQRLLPGAERLDGVVAGAHYDPAELLRPGWPVHAALADLAARVPGEAGARLIAFGADHGRMPTRSLQPDPALAGGPLRLLPFALLGSPAAVAEVGRTMEERLLDTGMAAAGLALQAQTQFGLRLEHARFLSLHDLCALVSMQYSNAGLDGVWQLIENALLTPDRDGWLREPGEPLALFRAGQVRIADPDPAAWHELADPDRTGSADHARFRHRLRQLSAVLEAHGIAVEAVPVSAGQDAASLLQRR